MTEYIQDFCCLVSHLGNWPECLLVHHLREGLNKELYQNCLSRRVLCNLRAWYHVATEVEIDLMELYKHTRHDTQLHWPAERQMAPREGRGGALPSRGGRPRQNLGGSFCCGKEGHRAAEYLALWPMTASPPLSQPKNKKETKKENSCRAAGYRVLLSIQQGEGSSRSCQDGTSPKEEQQTHLQIIS